jgi:tRNA modification GTPase
MTTITAIATATGGGIGIIRLSGDKSLKIAEQITQTKLKPRYAYYGNFYQNNQIIDKGIALFFPNPHSFTGEDVVELHCHGGEINTQNILQLTLQLGANLAEPGEFAKRAFLNGKIDLTQAEAIYDIINASSKTANKLALRSLTGEFANNIDKLKRQIIELRMFIEASIDFVDEEIDFIENNQTSSKLQDIEIKLQQILKNCKQGAILRNGLNIAIIGKPNAGKSSLLNALSGEDTAIVTDIAGTTRDIITESIIINDIKINIIDTAGIRKSADIVEAEGIKRAQAKASDADIILFMLAANEEPDLTLLPPNQARVIIVQNKIDNLKAKTLNLDYAVVQISAKNHTNLDKLKDLITKNNKIDDTQNLFLARGRHILALQQSLKFILNAKTEMQNQNFELVAEELNQTQKHLSEITGEFSSDDLLGEIFSSFCIGK